MAEITTREQELLEEFKAGLDKDGPVVMAARISELEDQVKALAADQAGQDQLLTESENGKTQLENDLVEANARADRAEKERDDALAAAKSADKARAKVERASAPTKPRKVGELADDKHLRGDKLREAVEASEQVEIVFSDGYREIDGVASAIVSGDAWKVHPRGLMLDKPVTIEGPQKGSSIEIAGYALLIDGKQVAWSERSDTLRVAPGQRVDLVDDIIF